VFKENRALKVYKVLLESSVFKENRVLKVFKVFKVLLVQ
jgi:hypothetical protein